MQPGVTYARLEMDGTDRSFKLREALGVSERR